MITIEIVKAPFGPAPDSVKKQWIGARMEAYQMPTETPIGEAIESDFTSGETQIARGGFVVKTETALFALALKSKEAARWFEMNLPEDVHFLSFGSDEAIIV